MKINPKDLIPWLAAAAFYAVLAIGVSWLIANGSLDGGDSRAVFGDQQKAAIDRISDIADQGIGVALGLLGLLGAALLRLEKAPPLDRAEAVAAILAMNLFLLSALGGVFLKLKVIEALLANLGGAMSYQLINPPMSAQLYGLILGLTAIAWIIARKAVARSAWTDSEGF